MEDLIRRTVGPSIELTTVAEQALWPALVDPSQLENALLNLCLNARDAMPDGGRITIETSNSWLNHSATQQNEVPDGEYLSLCVSDTGTGMPEDVIARVFEPFFTTKPIGEGTGLGLSMTYGFARQSGGTARITSTLGSGTTVALLLPRGLTVGEALPPPPPNAPRGRSQRILLVDDTDVVRMMVSEVLSDAGYHVIEAENADGALAQLRADAQIDMVVSDVGLPGMNGRDMADVARDLRPGLPILFITGYAENAATRQEFLAEGMALLPKPFSLNDLLNTVSRMLG